jgi:multidrug efflux pump subunit AcrA (membrane-fusion protein)
MWDTVEQRTVRWGRLAATAALLAGGVVLLARSLLMPGQPPAAVAGMQASPAPVAVAVPAPAASAPVLSRTQAATVVAQWQAVKARALGPEHDTSGLRGILRGEVLVQWQDRARQIQSKGW